MRSATHSLTLRLASPLQSWGVRSQHNRRETARQPTKSGIVGLLAAAYGRRRSDPIEDLVGLVIGVRTDRPGTLLRDYHTVSDYRGRQLLSSQVLRNGRQKPTSPAKHTAVTQRFYLEDAVFVVAVSGPMEMLEALAEAVLRPRFALSLGRRACPPTQPLLVLHGQDRLWPGDPGEVLADVPWFGRPVHQNTGPATVSVPVTVDDPAGDDIAVDVPASFDQYARGMTQRKVRSFWVELESGYSRIDNSRGHDPFALLGV